MEESAPLLTINASNGDKYYVSAKKRQSLDLSLNIALLTVLLQSVDFTVVMPSLPVYITKEVRICFIFLLSSVHGRRDFFVCILFVYFFGSNQTLLVIVALLCCVCNF